ncbi:MAG: diacylglycerol kinase [Acinetobacter sp.]|nr:diacylglycerol kinase [Acinetobacter sp.]
MTQHQESYAQHMKGKTGIKRILKASTYSRDGFIAAYKNEAAFRQVAWLNAILCISLIFLPFSIAIKMILVVVSALSIIVELFNTGLEAAIDRISDEFHPLAKIAKDVGSAAQFVVLSLLAVVWAMALYQQYMA